MILTEPGHGGKLVGNELAELESTALTVEHGENDA
jgi:hypothetical protein